MSLALAMTKDRNSVVERAKAERRHFMRARVEIAGRFFVPSDSREAQCKVVDLSPGGALLVSETVPATDTQIVLYIDGFGRLEGSVIRPSDTDADADEAASTPGSFGVQFHCSAMKRDKLAEQLTLYMNRGVVDETTVRRHDREPTKGLARFTRSNGEVLGCEVLDLSLSGVSLKTDARPPLGEIVLIGQTAGRVARHHETGIAIEFVNGQQDKAQGDQPANPFLTVR
ncbi:MAG TPA: PilZ domain-containing protein [Rhizomicrobium sp.]|nr:PilZ domain-containing protein [Rhizomicrobium sp.]